jgi:photosystem II stability/assembly factor-like uncharacterized protein
MVPVLADVATAGRAFAGTGIAGIHTTEDGGVAWTSSSKGLSVFVRGLVIHPEQPAIMYAAALLGGVYKSFDGGESWHNVGLNDSQVLDIAVHPRQPDVVYAATTQGVWLSVAGGTAWFPLGPRNPLGYGLFTLSLAIDPVRPHVVYAATGSDGVFKSFNSGIDWVPLGHSLESRSLLTILVDPRQPDTVYLGTAGSGVFVSDNGGYSWSPLSNGLYNGIVTALAADPMTPGVVYAGTEGGGVFQIRRTP